MWFSTVLYSGGVNSEYVENIRQNIRTLRQFFVETSPAYQKDMKSVSM